ncbi:hypothetical protein DM860_012244 [Cuscuta australis]|uniref:J domain-containing protein n=1 Tax=Cuscuta australis TaxID=267555 RepID=A0A328EAJ3_9ASTE|nr:hypothetical protein DM860_012244 [Cuscuta australis]
MESLSWPSHRSKLTSAAANGVSFSAKNAYDDVFSAAPKKRATGPTRPVWDYAEIFGPSRGSSIPVLDLSSLEDRAAAGSGDDFLSSKMDYSNIFGGSCDDDIALPYEEVVAERGKQRSSGTAGTSSQESNHCISSNNETNEVFAGDSSSDQSVEGEKRVNMSYHKTSQGAEDGLNEMTRIAQLHAVSGFTYFIDETVPLKSRDGSVSPPPVHVKIEKECSGEIHKRSSFDGFHFSDNLSNSELTSSKLTKPSISMFDDNNLHAQTKSEKDGFQRAPATESSSPSSNEELDANSDAAVSAAALKRAIEKAQESIRLAKELMERYKEGIPGHQKQQNSKIGDKEERRKGRNSKNTKAKDTVPHHDHAFKNGDIASFLKQCVELSTNEDTNKSECHRETISAPESDAAPAAETLSFEKLNSKKHRVWTVASQDVEDKNKDVKTIAENSPDPRWAMDKPGKCESLEFGIIEEKDEVFHDMESLEQMHDNNEEENIMIQELENDALVNGIPKLSKNEQERREYVECDELQKAVGDAHDCKQITKRARKTWNKTEIDLERRGNYLWVENENELCLEETCEDNHQVSQEGEARDERSNGACVPIIHECKETERLDEEHARPSDEVHKPGTDGVEESEKKIDEEQVRVEERIQEVYNNEAISCKDSEEIEEKQENQHIEAMKGAAEEIENVETETDTDDEFQEINVTLNGVEEIESGERETDIDKEYQEKNATLNWTEETPCTQSGATDVTPAASDEQKPYLTPSACNGYASYWLNEIQEDCTLKAKEISVETNEQNATHEENEGLQGVADTFSKLEEYSKEYHTTGELQSALGQDLCQNGKEGTGEDQFCDTAGENTDSMKHKQEIPNEREDSETDRLTHIVMQIERVAFEKDSLANNISDENVSGCKSDLNDEPEIQSSEEVVNLDFSGIDPGEKIIAENGKEPEVSSDAVNGVYVRVESALGEGTIKEDEFVNDDEADEDDVKTIRKEICSAENKKEQETSDFPSNKNEECTAGDGEKKETNSSKKIPEECEIKKSGEKFAGDKDQCGKLEVGKKERERDLERIAVERVIREARERAFAEARERAAAERATAEVRQRVMAEAREKVGKSSSAGSKQSLVKASSEAKLRAERAAVERATAEARERALEKALSQKSTAEVKVMGEKFGNRKYSGGASQENMLKHSISSDLERVNASTESAQRRKARLERHQRITERAAKALAEKNKRDFLAQKEQAERNRLAEPLDAEIKRWANGKEGNLRALLSTLQYILGPDSGWQPIHMTEIITAAAVKKGYRKATLCVHPDKLQQRGASIQQKYICEKVFEMLKSAWNKFNSEER